MCGATRNMVIGKVNRLGLIRAPKLRPASCGILDVSGCRWPLEVESPEVIGRKLFCNAVQCDGSPYCNEHLAQSVAPYSRDLVRRTIKDTVRTLARARTA